MNVKKTYGGRLDRHKASAIMGTEKNGMSCALRHHLERYVVVTQRPIVHRY